MNGTVEVELLDADLDLAIQCEIVYTYPDGTVSGECMNEAVARVYITCACGNRCHKFLCAECVFDLEHDGMRCRKCLAIGDHAWRTV